MNEKQIKKDYMSGLTYKAIQEKHNITRNKLIYLIQKNNWKRDSNRSKVQKGNKNAKNNKGNKKALGAEKGNKRALVTGEYENIFSSFLDEDEKIILESKVLSTKEALFEELQILKIREKRMFERIKILKDKQKDMVVTRMKKDNETTTTEVQNTLFLINKIEDGLTRVQGEKRRILNLLYKIEIDDGKIVENSNETEFERNTGLLDSINRQLLGGGRDG